METNLQSSEVRIPKTPQSPVCPQFKSTFARSLSFNQPSKPLDLEIYRVAQHFETTPINRSQNLSGSSTQSSQSQQKVDEVDEDFEEFMRNSPLKQSIQSLSMIKSSSIITPPTRKTNVIPMRSPSTVTCSDRNRFQVNE